MSHYLIARFSQEEQVCILNEAFLNFRVSDSDQQQRIWMEQYIQEGIARIERNFRFFEEFKKEIVDLQLEIKDHAFINHGNEESDVCSICLAEYEGRERIGVLKCGHQFHCDCIRGWLELKNVCPLCRSSTIDHL